MTAATIFCHAFILPCGLRSNQNQNMRSRPCQPFVFSAQTSSINIDPLKDVFIEEIKLDDDRQLQLMSAFCINMFYDTKESKEGSTDISRGWRSMKLAAMQKAQMLDLAIPTGGNRSIFVAKNASSEIIGCCEVIEEKLDLSYLHVNSNKNTRKKSTRLRPIIENLAVKPEYRRDGIGVDLVNACEKAVRNWIPKHDEIYAQVEEGNTSALKLFGNCGYASLFVDPTCKKVTIEDTLFARQSAVPKVMFRKFVSNESGLDLF